MTLKVNACTKTHPIEYEYFRYYKEDEAKISHEFPLLHFKRNGRGITYICDLTWDLVLQEGWYVVIMKEDGILAGTYPTLEKLQEDYEL